MMSIVDRLSEVEVATKPVFSRLEVGKDFRILEKTFSHTTISLDMSDDKILKCQGHDLLLIGISFKAGMKLEKHTTEVPARLVVLHGEIVYHNDLASIRLEKYEEHSIPVDEPHWVSASKDSIIMLIKNQES